MEAVLFKLNGLISRERLGPNKMYWMPDDLKVVRLAKLLLLREQELAEPEPPKHSTAWYFWPNTTSCDAAKKALYDALPTLLNAWLNQKGEKR
jgi:hypothetical protein